MNSQRAENIIKYRSEIGPFKSRDELKKVKAIGSKTFEQCAGFIRIDRTTANLKGKYNILDSTWVHPESYDITHKICTKFMLSINDIGTEPFISRIKMAHSDNRTIGMLADEFRVPEERVCNDIFSISIRTVLSFKIISIFVFLQIQSVLEALGRELQKDYRDDADIRPLFKQGLLKMSDLKAGTMVTGAVSNITTFGCFVDIGVKENGFIHSSQMRGQTPNIGDRVNSTVLSVDEAQGRIKLRLECIL